MNVAPVSGSPDNNAAMIAQIDAFITGLNPPAGTTVATAIVTRTAGTSATNTDDTLKVEPPKTDQDMKDFVLKHSATLVENSVKSILELQKIAIATGDPEMVAGLAGLISASTAAIETVNKMVLLNKKAADAREIKLLEIESKKELQKLKNDGYLNLPSGGAHILIATREEIIAGLTGKAKEKTEVVDIETTSEFSALSGEGSTDVVST